MSNGGINLLIHLLRQRLQATSALAVFPSDDARNHDSQLNSAQPSQATPTRRAFAQAAQAASAGRGVEGDEGIQEWYQDEHGTWHDSSVEAYDDFSGHGDASESPWSDHDGGPGGGL